MDNERGVVEVERLEKQSYSPLTIADPGIGANSEWQQYRCDESCIHVERRQSWHVSRKWHPYLERGGWVLEKVEGLIDPEQYEEK